jgi:hypothetical protein
MHALIIARHMTVVPVPSGGRRKTYRKVRNMKKRRFGIILLALCLAAMATVPVVSAEENSSRLSQPQQPALSTISLITFDGLSTTGSQLLNDVGVSNAVSSSITKYETLEIDAKTLKTRLLSGKQTPIHLNGVPYFMDLHEETFYPGAETGVYTFNGHLVSADGHTFPESSVQLTLDDNGILGHLSVDPSETIYLDEVSDDYPRIPEQQIAYSSKDVIPHTIDVTNDLIVNSPSRGSSSDAQFSDDVIASPKTGQETTAPVNTSSDRKPGLLESIIGLNLQLITGPGENAVSNLYILPAGTFSLFPKGNASPETGMMDKISSDVPLLPQDWKINDSEVDIGEWNRSAREPGDYQRNVTIIHVTEDDFDSYPELQQAMLEVRDKPPANSSEWGKRVSYFSANQSDYYGWLLDSICENKTRIECYADLAAFEYHGRYYFIDIASF